MTWLTDISNIFNKITGNIPERCLQSTFISLLKKVWEMSEILYGKSAVSVSNIIYYVANAKTDRREPNYSNTGRPNSQP